jgi:hypothetical protein
MPMATPKAKAIAILSTNVSKPTPNRSRMVEKWLGSRLHPSRTSGEREELALPNETRYIRRDDEGHFTGDQVDKGESLARDRQRQAQHEAPKGQGDRGDESR